VKQAVFNSLGDRVVGARVLELFAGSGALSLESLSRGAAQAVCVEKSFKHAEFIRRNVADAGLAGDRLQLRVQDVFPALRALLAESARFDLVLADPPYGAKNAGKRSESLAQATLDDDVLPCLVVPGGLLVLGHARRDTLTLPDFWTEQRVLKHGDNIMRFLRPMAHGLG
jgi:16S rRNA (guanine(966)-N(2))-methyltransferase RsmD